MDFDLNLLKVFAAVADTGSVTRAASRLYVTQPAVSASLKRLTEVVGTELFVRQGRGLVLTERGRELFAKARTHLDALINATVAPPAFDPTTSRAILRLGLADGAGFVLLSVIAAAMRSRAPNMQLVCVPVQFRTVEEALLTGGLTAAICVADEMPKSISREVLDSGSNFVALYDADMLQLPKRLSTSVYFAHEHVIVSYAGDLRGIVEDTLEQARTVRVSLPSFNYIPAAITGTKLIATVPDSFVASLQHGRPQLQTSTLLFEVPTSPFEMLWANATNDDPAATFFRQLLRDVVRPTLRVRSSARGDRGGSSRARRSP